MRSFPPPLPPPGSGAMEPKRQRKNQTPVLVVLCVVLALAQGAPVKPWSWETISSFVHCSNHSGPLNKEITQLMAASSFAVIEKYQCLECEPKEHGGEGKVLAAAAQIRAVNPDAAVFLYFAVDYTRTWYNLGSWFDAHPELEVHNADGSLTTVHQHDDGNNTWHVFDFAKTEAVEKWVGDVAATVTTGQLDGVFIDGCVRRLYAAAAAQHSTSTSTVQHRAAQHSTAQAPCSTAPHRAAQHSTAYFRQCHQHEPVGTVQWNDAHVHIALTLRTRCDTCRLD